MALTSKQLPLRRSIFSVRTFSFWDMMRVQAYPFLVEMCYASQIPSVVDESAPEASASSTFVCSSAVGSSNQTLVVNTPEASAVRTISADAVLIRISALKNALDSSLVPVSSSSLLFFLQSWWFVVPLFVLRPLEFDRKPYRCLCVRIVLNLRAAGAF